MRVNILDEDLAGAVVRVSFDEMDASRATEMLARLRSVGGYLEAELSEGVRLQFFLQEPGDFWVEYVDWGALMKQGVWVVSAHAASLLEAAMRGENPTESHAFGTWISSTLRGA